MVSSPPPDTATTAPEATRSVVHVICQAHIDPVWLWTRRDGFAEMLTTLQSAVDRMREFPGMRYTCSTAAVYRWVQQTDPRLFSEIVDLIREGRWEVVGGWVVQADTNLPSELALIRQGVLGKQWIREFLGIDEVPIGYCVDSFGHSAGLPSILAASGIRYYVFTRPHTSHRPDLPFLFWWEGPDGSRVLALRLPTLYCQAPGTTADGLETILRREMSACLMPGLPLGVWFLGIGNHGGGPARTHVERLRSLQNRIDPTLPELRFSTLAGFFASVEQQPGFDRLPVIRGELLHEFRGCYSANTKFKRSYRSAERELLTAERLLIRQKQPDADLSRSTLAHEMPPASLREAWWTLSFNQFHDILPGSSVPSAYDEAHDDLGAIRHIARNTTTALTQSAARRQDTQGAPEGVLFVLNPHSWPRRAIVALDTFTSPHGDSPITHLASPDGETVPIQFSAPEAPFGPHFKDWKKLTAVVDLPANGSRWFHLAHSAIPPEMENGGISSILQSMARSARLIAVEDNNDTWGHNLERLDTLAGSAIITREKQLDDGRVFRRHRQWLTLGHSSLFLDLIEWPALDMVELNLRINWQDRRQALKLELSLPADYDRLYALTPGAVVDRPLDGKEWPFQDWLAFTNEAGRQSLVIVNDGVSAYDATPERVRFTLLRCVPHALHDPVPFHEDSPEPFLDEGRQQARFWLKLQPGPIDTGALERLSEELNTSSELMLDSAHPPAAIKT